MKDSFKEDLFLLSSQAITKSLNVLQHFNDYVMYCKTKKIHQSERAVSFTYNQLKFTISFLKDIQNTLEYNNCTINKLIQIEIEIRVAMQAIASAQLYLSWRSPVYSQAMIPQFFNLDDQGTKRILYERWGYKEINRIETQLLKIFDLPNEEFGCTIVNSGMAAFSLVESFLIRNVLKPGDSIVASPYIYFESKEQLKSIKWLKFIESESYEYRDIIRIIEDNNAKVVFIDVLTNTIEQRMVDIESLLDYFKNHRNVPLFIIDGTMLPCAVVSYIASFPKRKQIFYIESCSKYLQLGLDMSIAGVLIYDASLKSKFNILRRNMGLILTEYNAHLFPVYKRNQLINKIFRIESNACEIAHNLSMNHEITKLYDIIYPNLSNHPDNLLAKKIGRYGGCIAFRLKIKHKDQIVRMDALMNTIINNARLDKFPIAQGLSFGFSFPRITTDIFYTKVSDSIIGNIALRLYAGDQGKLNKRLIKLMENSFKQHINA